jgi:type IV pilus assembly protein PilY1
MNTTTDPTDSDDRQARFARRASTRALVWLLCALNAMPAWATSTLIQYPPFSASEPASNVFVMVDDSASMGDHALPLPAGITIPTSVPATVTIQGDGADANNTWALRSWQINRDFDWRLRSPALNPLWYNPAIRYAPWNKDGTPLPNASIGGNSVPTHWGAITSRPDVAQLTERDPRQVASGGSYVSIKAGAGRGLIGTDLVDPIHPQIAGRRVTLTTPSVDFRYWKMPFDFGPAKPGATTAPGNGHASIAWTTHNEASSPLDLFQRPITSIAGTPRTGCFSSLAQCQSGAAAAPPVLTERWLRNDCSGASQSFGSNPGSLTCYRARCGTSGSWSAWSPTQPTLSCPFQWTDCFGNLQTSPTNPGPISCGWRRQDCAGAWQNFGSDPGSLTCYRTRDCAGGGWGSWSPTNPGSLPACWQRQNCSGTWEYFSGADPGPLSCSWSRQNCFGTTETFATNPGSLTCWQRQDCAGTNQIFTADPGTLSCGWQRQNCPGTTESFVSNPGNLTCYQRNNCSPPGGMTGPQPTPISPSSVSCLAAGEADITYNTTTFTRTPSEIVRSPSTFSRTPSGGGTRNSSSVPRTETSIRTPLAPSTITPTQLTQNNETTINAATRSDLSSCPTGTSTLSCTAGAIPNIPDPAALTPARYYRYIGTGSKGDPANYRVVMIDRARASTTLFPVIDAATGVAATATNSRRTDCANRTQCTLLEEAQNFANWWLYYRNRLFAAKAVMSEAMSGMVSQEHQNLRLGYGRINYFSGAVNPWRTAVLETIGALPDLDGFANPGALVRGVRPFLVGSAERAAFFDWLFSLSWVGRTPNREAIDSVGRYFSWADNRGPWGSVPGTSDTTPQLGCRRNSTLLATDGEWTNVTSGQPLISSTGGLATPGTPVESDNTNGPTITGDGANAGKTFQYKPADWLQFTGGANQSGTLTDAAVYYWNRDLRPDLPNTIKPIDRTDKKNPAFWQSMTTYIVGYGLTASMDTPDTRTKAIAGGTVTWPTVDLTSTTLTGGERVNDNLRAALATRGDFYAAQDIEQLKSGILTAFEQIVAQEGAAGGVAVTGASITGGSRAFFPSYTTSQWTGQLRAYSSGDLENLSQGLTVTPQWSATVPPHASRNVLTSTATNTPKTFVAGHLSAAQTALLTTVDHTADEVVAYVRGDTSKEIGNAGGKFRRRLSTLADFVNSSPLYVKAPDYGFGAMPTVGASYKAYVDGRRGGTAENVFIGGNGGLFHGFDAATGAERFAYVPRGVYADLKRLLSPSYQHRYFVDGPVTGGDWHDGSAWRSVVVGTTGAGGASIFAIDTTNPTTFGPSSVLWDLTKAESDHIGHVLSRGVVGRVKTGATTSKWVYVTGNGYESNSNRAALLVIDIATGALTTIPVGPTWTASMGLDKRNGMGGVTVRFDGYRNLAAVYAGDRQGNLWRFDFSAGVPTAAKGFDGSNSPLFTATDGTRPRPITTAPRLALHPRGGSAIVFGTGKLYDEGDYGNTHVQAIYGLWEKEGHGAAIAESQLRAISIGSGPGSTRTFSLASVNWSTDMGWRVSLPAGERVISDPSAELGALTIATFVPVAGGDSCSGGGTSWLYRLNFASGEATGTTATGVTGTLTPLVAMPGRTRTASSVSLTDALKGVPGSIGGGGGGESSAQCRLYSASISGLPHTIQQTCPAFTPLRVWRQPTR